MDKCIAFFLLLSAVFYNHSQAQQTPFIQSGKIVFERQVNTFAALPIFLRETGQVPEDQIPTFMEQYRSSAPQFWKDSFELYFDKAYSMYQPKNKDIEFSKTFAIPFCFKNRVYTDFTKQETISEKFLAVKNVYTKDSTRRIKWKLTDETREIAGFQCHRANAIIMDSIYLVAFYTDQILTRSGPESLTGLPGMILGVALPHQHLTIFATKVYEQKNDNSQWSIPEATSKNPYISREAFNTMAKGLLKQYNLTSLWVQSFMEL